MGNIFTWGVVGEEAGGVSRDCVGVAEERPEIVDSLLLHPPLCKLCFEPVLSISIIELALDSTDKLILRLSLSAVVANRDVLAEFSMLLSII